MAALRDAMAMEHHTAIMEAALDRDIERAKALMTEHIGYTLHVYMQAEEERQQASGGAANARSRPRGRVTHGREFPPRPSARPIRPFADCSPWQRMSRGKSYRLFQLRRAVEQKTVVMPTADELQADRQAVCPARKGSDSAGCPVRLNGNV